MIVKLINKQVILIQLSPEIQPYELKRLGGRGNKTVNLSQLTAEFELPFNFKSFSLQFDPNLKQANSTSNQMVE